MRFIGIDVGLSGALAFVDQGVQIADEKYVSQDSVAAYRSFDMPIVKVRTRRFIDEQKLIYILKLMSIRDSMVFLEQQQPFSKQGVTSTFHLGRQYGFIRGVVQTLGLRMQDVRPKDWQREYNIVGNTKGQSYLKASALFPNASLVTPRGRIIDGRSDALLISEFARRKYAGAG